MRYLVTARVKPGQEQALLDAIDQGTLGAGSVAEGEYLRNMGLARLRDDGSIRWVEVCFCNIPLDEERSYWEQFFELVKVKDAHARTRCRDETGEEPWACGDCDCTDRLEARLAREGRPFVDVLRQAAAVDQPGDVDTTLVCRRRLRSPIANQTTRNRRSESPPINQTDKFN